MEKAMRGSLTGWAVGVLAAALAMAGCDGGALVPGGGDPVALTIQQKVAKLSIGTSTLAEVVGVFGEPGSYRWDNQEFAKDDLPNVYMARYVDVADIVMVDGHVSEIRFAKPGYVYAESIEVGSSLAEVLAVVGEPAQTVVGEGNQFVDGVLYKDISGESGTHYLACASRGVRFFFKNGCVCQMYLTSNAARGS